MCSALVNGRSMPGTDGTSFHEALLVGIKVAFSSLLPPFLPLSNLPDTVKK